MPETRKPRLLLVVTEDWYFASHRLALARAARRSGYDVAVATRVDRCAETIRREGARLIPISLRRSGRNPLREAGAIAELTRLYRREAPDIVHHVALKPVLYGSLAAKLAGVPAVVNAMAGLGFVFIAGGVTGSLRRAAMRQALRLALMGENSRTVFQNSADLEEFVSGGLLPRDRTVLIRGGSGVDLGVFRPCPEPAGPPVALLPARMLWDKGVGEFVAAARRLRAAGVAARFALVGASDADNPAAAPAGVIEEWRREGCVEVWGHRDDMPAVFASSAVVCLPSYREGCPKALLEAAACGRAIVTTDVPGCRDIVRDGENGRLVAPRDAAALSRALAELLSDAGLRARMGLRGREIAVAEFSEESVVSQTLLVYARLLERTPPSQAAVPRS